MFTFMMTTTKERRAWQAMKQRCGNPNNPQFHNYGGRGIRVCERWAGSFEAFFSDVGRAPSPKHSVDRIDNDGNYEPGNVRWATSTQQGRNKRVQTIVTVFGKEMTLAEAAERFGIGQGVAAFRLRLSRRTGLPLEEALAIPVAQTPSEKGRLGYAIRRMPSVGQPVSR